MTTHLCIWKGQKYLILFFLQSPQAKPASVFSLYQHPLWESCQQWRRKGFETSECRALKSPYNHGAARDNVTALPTTACHSTGIEQVPDNWVEAVEPSFHRGGGCGFIKVPTFSRTIMEHVLHVLLESISSTQRERLWWITSRESWGQFMLAQGVCLLGWNGWLGAQRKSHEFNYKI